jgi:hypothetical protein
MANGSLLYGSQAVKSISTRRILSDALAMNAASP